MEQNACGSQNSRPFKWSLVYSSLLVLPLSPSCTSVLFFCSTAVRVSPIWSEYSMQFHRKSRAVRTALARRATSIEASPWAPTLLWLRSRRVSAALEEMPAAMASAPSGPMLLPASTRCVRVLLTFRTRERKRMDEEFSVIDGFLERSSRHRVRLMRRHFAMTMAERSPSPTDDKSSSVAGSVPLSCWSGRGRSPSRVQETSDVERRSADPKLSQVFHSEGKWGMAGREETSSAVKEVLIRRARPMYFNPYARSLFRKLRSVRTLLNSRSAAMSIASACFSPSCDRSVTSSSNPQMVFRDVCCLKTEVITDATSSPISLPSSETWVKVELVLRASAMVTPALGPSALKLRSSLVRAGIKSTTTLRTVRRCPPSFLLRSRMSPVMPAAPSSPLRNA
mmetsp:Transcript_23920/g.54422  ORF Transcript_23920/g.54422 Transcript_23920/m.54422 type:complete len:395 (+) Transcript_23920:301-1485(+)